MFVTWFIATRAGLTGTELRAFDLSDWTVSWSLVAAASLLLFGAYVLAGWTWGRIVTDLGGPRLPLAVSPRIFLVANLGRYVPGKVWAIAGIAALGAPYGIQPATAAGAAIVGQGITLVAATTVGLGALWSLADGTWRWALPLGMAAAIAVGLLPPCFAR